MIISLALTDTKQTPQTPVQNQAVDSESKTSNEVRAEENAATTTSNLEEIDTTAQDTLQNEPQLYSVIKVVDGDTIAVNINGESETLRLIGIDTPETVDPRKGVECFGKEASAKARELLDGANVKLEADESQGERDKYGRLLRYVFLEDGTHFNELMIREGYAHEYTYDLPYKYQGQFKAAESNAKQDERGLWASDACPLPAPTSTTPTPSTSKSDQETTQTSPTRIIAPAPSPQPSTSSNCSCSGNTKNCGDFSTHNAAQACYEYCLEQVGTDIHRLDRDDDGSACESLP